MRNTGMFVLALVALFGWAAWFGERSRGDARVRAVTAQTQQLAVVNDPPPSCEPEEPEEPVEDERLGSGRGFD